MTPGSALYRFMEAGRLDLRTVARPRMSGQDDGYGYAQYARDEAHGRSQIARHVSVLQQQVGGAMRQQLEVLLVQRRLALMQAAAGTGSHGPAGDPPQHAQGENVSADLLQRFKAASVGGSQPAPSGGQGAGSMRGGGGDPDRDEEGQQGAVAMQEAVLQPYEAPPGWRIPMALRGLAAEPAAAAAAAELRPVGPPGVSVQERTAEVAVAVPGRMIAYAERTSVSMQAPGGGGALTLQSMQSVQYAAVGSTGAGASGGLHAASWFSHEGLASMAVADQAGSAHNGWTREELALALGPQASAGSSASGSTAGARGWQAVSPLGPLASACHSAAGYEPLFTTCHKRWVLLGRGCTYGAASSEGLTRACSHASAGPSRRCPEVHCGQVRMGAHGC